MHNINESSIIKTVTIENTKYLILSTITIEKGMSSFSDEIDYRIIGYGLDEKGKYSSYYYVVRMSNEFVASSNKKQLKEYLFQEIRDL